MANPTEEYFDRLAKLGHEPLLAKISGRMRFDLTEDGQVICYLITVDAGKLTVSRERLDANTVVHAPRPVFDRIASGLQNGMVAVLRGVISVEGDLELVVLLQRLLPGPPGQQPRTRAGIRTPAPANSVAKG